MSKISITVTLGSHAHDSNDVVEDFTGDLQEAIQSVYPRADVSVETDFRTARVIAVEVDCDEEGRDAAIKDDVLNIYSEAWQSFGN